MVAMDSMLKQDIVIPESFKVGDMTIRLKEYLRGSIDIKDNEYYFVCLNPYFSCKLGSISKKLTKFEIKKEVQKFIGDTYKKYITNKGNLITTDRAIFGYIKSVSGYNESKSNSRKVCIVGYKDNYLNTIQSTTLGLHRNVVCKNIELPENMDILIGKNADKTLSYIKSRIEKYNSDYFVIDLTNLYLTNFSTSKALVEYIESKGGKILFLVNELNYSKTQFIKIYGEKYKDSCVDRREYIYARQKSLLEKSKNILFN